MNVQGGDVVLVEQPYTSGVGAKRRPALVIQNDRDNQRLSNTIIAQITSLTRRSTEPTQFLIEVATPDGQQSGLHKDSVVNCVNLFTVDKSRIIRRIGTLSTNLMQQADPCLKAALQLP
jgi:mRNA interferase MazF